MKKTTKFYKPSHPVRCFITGPSEREKSYILSNSILNKNKEVEKIYTYSPSLYHDLYQKWSENFSNYISKNLIPKFYNA